MTAHLRLVEDSTPAGPALLGGSVHYPGTSTDPVTGLHCEGLGEHVSRFGPRRQTSYRDGVALVEVLDDIGLTGRGGGHFPVAAKWRAVRAALDADRDADGSVVVANGAEGEPLSGKDAALLQLRPHLVLDGLACTAEALGAADAVIWLHERAHTSRAAVTRALAERAAAQLCEPPMRVAIGPDRYLSGESSAVTRALAGGPALPRFRPDPATPARIDGRPALVQNVETLARVAVAARDACTVASSLLSVAVPGHRVVLEVASSTRMGEAVASVLGATAPHAVLVGGYGGSWVTWNDISDAALNETALRARGLSLGAGVVFALPVGTCGLAHTAEFAEYLAASSARQCGPCLFGLRAVADGCGALARFGSGRRDTSRLRRFLADIAGRGGCHHPDGAVRMVSTALVTFADDVAAHLEGRCLHAPAVPSRRGLRRA